MPSGHTQTEDINERRPISGPMLALLQLIKKSPVFWSELTPAGKNRVRALRDRGYVTSEMTRLDNKISITESGKSRISD